jgi:hypothetical protein
MAEPLKGPGRYHYGLNIQTSFSNSFNPEEASVKDIQRFVDTTLGLLTGSCELCIHSHYVGTPSLYCEELNRPVKKGDPRCEHFVRRQSAELNF